MNNFINISKPNIWIPYIDSTTEGLVDGLFTMEERMPFVFEDGQATKPGS